MKVGNAKKNKRAVRREWTKSDVKELKTHSKARTPVIKISKLTKRTVGALRQKALLLGIGLGINGKRNVASGRSYKALAWRFCDKIIFCMGRRRLACRLSSPGRCAAHEVSMLAVQLPGSISQTWAMPISA